MESYPLFSVLVANYNNGQYLEEAINSVRSQSYTNWEIIIVDDESTDHSQEIYQQYANDSRIKIYYNEINKGCGYTKRRCAELANGTICGFLAPVDALMPDAIEIMATNHLSHPETALIFSRFYFCDENLTIKEPSRQLTILKGQNYFTNRNYLPEHFASFKKEFYNQTEGISPLYKLGVDQDLYFKLEEVGHLLILNKLTYKYRNHKQSISADGRKARYWNLIIRHETCMRRGLDPELYSYQDFISFMTINSLSPEEQHIIHKAESDLLKIRQSKAYRLGKFILKPFSYIRHKLK